MATENKKKVTRPTNVISLSIHPLIHIQIYFHRKLCLILHIHIYLYLYNYIPRNKEKELWLQRTRKKVTRTNVISISIHSFIYLTISP